MADPAAKPEETSLETYKQMFSESQSLTQDQRQDADIDQDYYDGNQWTADEKRKLAFRKQPDNVFNRVRPAVDGTRGVLEQGATDPRAFARNPDDEDAADVATKALRFAAERARFSNTKREVIKDYFVAGIGAAIIEVDEDLNVKPRQIRYEEFFYDPRSRSKDFSDARYMGVAKWMYAADVKAMYPDKQDDIESAISAGGSGLPADQFMQDRPQNAIGAWVDRKARRMLLVEMYHRDAGQWMRCVFHASGKLEYGPSSYLDHKGKPMCPIEAQSCYVDKDNNRYGTVRDMRGPQDEINKRRSKALWRASAAQIQATDAAALEVDASTARAEAARPDGVIPFGYQRVIDHQDFQSEVQLLQHATSEIERQGPNPAILGRQAADSSGRAQLVRQQAGMTELAIVFGGLEDWELRVYRQIWARIRQFWKAPMFIRVTDDVKAAEFVGINQPIHGPGQVVQGPDGMATIQPQVLGYKNAVGEMDVDIEVVTTPDTASVQQEQFLGLMDMIGKTGAQVPLPILIEASTLPNKREIIEKLQAASQQQPDPMQQLEVAGAAAKVDETKSKTVLNLSRAHTEQGEAAVDAFHAGHQAGLEPAAGVTGAPGMSATAQG